MKKPSKADDNPDGDIDNQSGEGDEKGRIYAVTNAHDAAIIQKNHADRTKGASRKHQIIGQTTLAA